MIKEDKLTIKNDTGIEKDFDILFTYESEKTKMTYIAYTDFEKDEKGDVIIYTGCYDKEDPKLKLNELETQDEIDMMDNFLKNIIYDAKNNPK